MMPAAPRTSGTARLPAALRSSGHDPLDEAGFPLLRARVTGTMWLSSGLVIGLLLMVSSPQFPVRSHPVLTLAAAGACAAEGVWALVRGARLGDLEFTFLVTSSLPLLVVFVEGIQPVGSPVAVEWGGLSTVIAAAVLARRRWQVAVPVAAAAVSMLHMIVQRLGPSGAVPAVAAVELFVLLTVTLVVRALREVAEVALARASHGEVTDPLTGLSNRRGLERYGRRVWEERARQHAPVALLVVDIDHFKRINDSLGHAVGDDVIRSLAALLTSSMRQDDVVVRMGGEEFLILVNAGPGEAVGVAERLRARVEASLAPVTVSIGVVEAAPGLADELPTTLWRAADVADQALYEAKNAGRNRVVAAAAD